MKIQEILSEIAGLLQEKDLSCTPRFRELEDAYCRACTSLQEELDDCRELMRNHDMERAAARNFQASPPLTERARMLQFPGLTQWKGLCGLYGLEIPKEFDNEMLQALEHACKQAGIEKRDSLLAQWRNTARTGTSHEKVLLLRKMIQVIPDDPAWRKNLETAERAWVMELQKEARLAQQLKDFRHLFSVYTQLTLTDLSHPVPETVLAPFLADVRAYQQQETERRSQETLKQVADAYAMGDLALLGTSLDRYAEIAKSTYFKETPESHTQIEEARKFHRQKTALEAQKNEARSLQEALRKQLDERVPFKEIDAAYRKLLLLDSLPIADELKQRYQERALQAKTEDLRRFRRRTAYGFLLSLLAIAAAVFAVQQVQKFRASQRIEQEMQLLMEQNTPEKAIALHNALLKQRKEEAETERVLARRQQAEHQIGKEKNESDAFDKLLQEIRDNLTEHHAELPEQALRFQTADKFANQRTIQQQAELRKLHIQSADLCRKLQSQRDTVFEKKVDSLCVLGRLLQEELKKKDTVSVAEIEQRIFLLEQQTLTLTEGKKRVTPAVLNRGRKTLQDITALLRRTAKDVAQHQKTAHSLNAPKSIEVYLTGFKEMHRTAPELVSQFSAAEKQIPGVETRLQIPWKSLQDPSEETLKNTRALLLKGDPCCNDLAFILPQEEALQKLRTAFRDFQDKTLPSWDLYELTLQTPQGERRFYLKATTDIEVERSGGKLGGRYHSLLFTYVTSEQQHRESVALSLKRTTAGYVPNLHTALKRTEDFPEEFSPVSTKTLDAFSCGKLPKAAHFLLMHQILERLQRDDSLSHLSKTLWNEIIDCTERKDLSPEAKGRIVLQLLQWTGEISNANRMLVERIKEKLRLETVKDSDWLLGQSGSAREKFARIPEFFASTTFKTLHQTAENTQKLYLGCIARYPVPAGVLYRRKGVLEFHPFAYTPSSEEYLVFLPVEQNRTRIYRLPNILIQQKTVPAAKLPDFYSRIRHGEIVYTPKTLESFDHFLKRNLPALNQENSSLSVLRMPESVPQEMPK